MITSEGHRAFSKYGRGLHKAFLFKVYINFLVCCHLVKTSDRNKNLSEQFLRTLFNGGKGDTRRCFFLIVRISVRRKLMYIYLN